MNKKISYKVSFNKLYLTGPKTNLLTKGFIKFDEYEAKECYDYYKSLTFTNKITALDGNVYNVSNVKVFKISDYDITTLIKEINPEYLLTKI